MTKYLVASPQEKASYVRHSKRRPNDGSWVCGEGGVSPLPSEGGGLPICHHARHSYREQERGGAPLRERSPAGPPDWQLGDWSRLFFFLQIARLARQIWLRLPSPPNGPASRGRSRSKRGSTAVATRARAREWPWKGKLILSSKLRRPNSSWGEIDSSACVPLTNLHGAHKGHFRG